MGLGEIAEVVGGVTKDSKREGRENLVEVPYLRVANVQRGRIDTTNVSTIRVPPEKAAQLELKPGDVLLNEGGDRDKLGRGWIWQGQIPCCIHQNHVFRARVHEGLLHPKLLAWYANEVAHKWFEDNGKQSVNLASISLSKIRMFPVLVPPIAEQQRIVDILEDHLSHLDAASASVRAARSRIQNLRLRLLESLIPRGAPRRTLGEIALSAGYGTSTKCAPNGQGVPVVRIPNLRGGRVDLIDEKKVVDPDVDLSKLMLNENDLLVVRTNGSRELIGRVAVVQAGIDASFASYLIRFQLDPQVIRPEWARNMLGGRASRRVLEGMAASSAGQYNLGLKKLNSVGIACPPLEVQDRLLLELDLHESGQLALARSLDLAEIRGRSLRRSLLTAAFSGRLTGRPSDLEQVEEMAGV